MASPSNNGPGTPSPSRRRPTKKKKEENKLQAVDVTLVTPFGMGCRLCGKPFGTSLWSMQRHLNGHGVSVSRSESQSLIEHQMTLLQSVMQDISSVSEYMTGEKVKGYSCHCLVGSLKLQNVYRHLSSGRTCGAPSPTEEELQISTCGRMISLKALQIKYSCQEAPSLKTSTQLQATLHVLPDMMGCFVPLFHPLAQDEPYPSRPKGRSFKERVHFLYDSINLKHIIDNQPLFDLLYHQGENWLTAQAALHVQMVPANYRSRLLVFDGARSPNAISTFTFTAYPKRLLPEFKKLLSFLCQSNHKLLPLTRDIPSLLAKLCLETVDSVQHHTTVMTYCAGRVVRGQEGSETLSVWSPSYIATMLSAILAMLRASICSMIYFMGRGYHEKASRLVENVQNSITVNFLASTIRRMRERESLTPSSRKVSIQDKYNILVDGFMFKFQKWSNVIPIIFDKLVASLCKVIKGNRWVNLLNRRYPLFVCWSSRGKTTMTLASGHKNYSQEDIVLQDDYDLCDIDVFASYLELAFHGTGLGSMRYTEISRSLFSDVRWHGGCVYYYSHSEKAFSVHHKGKNLIEHKLCTTLSRAYMVFRVLCELRHESLGCLVPVRNNRAFYMGDAVATIFGFEDRPDCTQIRHLWTSVSNVLFPQVDETAIHNQHTTQMVAEQSGHSYWTHRDHYGSLSGNTKEELFMIYHKALGEKLVQKETVIAKGLSDEQILLTLRKLFGPAANYTCDQQRDMLHYTCSEYERHGHFGLPCGGGKSMSWILPTTGVRLYGTKQQTTLVIVPYKFLAGYHDESMISTAKQTKVDVRSVTLTASDFSLGELPDVISDMKNLPDVVFMSLDAIWVLERNHSFILKEWVTAGKLGRIIVDEIHTIYSEIGFRTRLECLPRLAKYEVPIMTLSGSLPRRFLPPLMKYLALSKGTLDDMTISHSDRVLGSFPSGFRFSVVVDVAIRYKFKDFIQSTMNSFTRLGHGIHVIVASKQLGMDVVASLEEMSLGPVEFVTSETTTSKQRDIAKRWSASAISILVSSTVALVGNENPKCHCVVVVGHLFSLMSVVQALGRLRPKQRTGTSSFVIFANKLSSTQQAAMEKEDMMNFHRLRELGVIDTSNEQDYMQIGTIKGLVDWETERGKCRVVSLAGKFGSTYEQCNVCDVCIGRQKMIPVQVVGSQAKQKEEIRTTQVNDAMLVLITLKERCLVCGRRECQGDACLTKGCFNCGGDHFRRDCRFSDFLTNHYKGRICYKCLDYHERPGYQSHSLSNCP